MIQQFVLDKYGWSGIVFIISHALALEPKMTLESPIFKTFSFVFITTRILGLYPCKRIQEDNGKISILTINFKKQLKWAIGIPIIWILAIIASVNVIVYRIDINVGKFFSKGFGQSLQSNNVAVYVDTLIEVINLLLSVIIGNFMAIELNLKRNDISKVFNEILKHCLSLESKFSIFFF